MKKKIIIIVSAIVFVLLLIFGIKLFTNHKDGGGSTTGHWYGKPKNADEILSVEIVYNDGHDIINVYPDQMIMTFYAFDDKGNYVRDEKGEPIIKVVDITSEEIVNEIFNDAKHLNEYNANSEAKWRLSIQTVSTTCLAQGTDEEPKWFKDILEKIDVKENGYLYK